MKWTALSKETRLELVGLFILVIGLGVAVYIDQTAVDEPYPVLGYEVNSESTQPIRPDDSKRYLRDLEQYNGKAGVLLFELRNWFAGLWRGKTLARTLFCLTVATTFAILYYARHLPPESSPGSQREKDQE